MSGSESDGKGGFKVLDRRRFDSDGNERPASETVNPAAGAASKPEPVTNRAEPKPQAGPSPTPPDEASHYGAAAKEASSMGTEELSVSFSSFVVSLATQALMQLGQMPPPDGVTISPDPEAAKQTIDILSMMQIKTKGNLDPDEARLLEEILHNLRLGFIRSAGR